MYTLIIGRGGFCTTKYELIICKTINSQSAKYLYGTVVAVGINVYHPATSEIIIIRYDQCSIKSFHYRKAKRLFQIRYLFHQIDQRIE